MRINEMSPNAGGLLRWPVKILLPLGFGLLALQGVSELIKRLAFLAGLIDDPNKKDKCPTPEEELAAAIAASAKNNK
jgi:TRAP-type mannitol/chloroaromatic compound transport system permease small subunit